MRAEEAKALANSIRNKTAEQWFIDSESAIMHIIHAAAVKGDFAVAIYDDSPLGRGLFSTQEHRKVFEERMKRYGYTLNYSGGSYQDETKYYGIAWT